MSSFVTGWYLIYTRPRFERKVVEHLNEENIICYLPTFKTIRNRNKRRRMIEVLLFPSYVFVYLEKLQDYYAGLNTEGTLYYVRFGKQIARISEIIIDNLKILINEGKDLEISSHYFVPSQQLMIREGPLTGLLCEVVQHKNKEKILVRINLLSRCILVDMPANNLMELQFSPASI